MLFFSNFVIVRCIWKIKKLLAPTKKKLKLLPCWWAVFQHPDHFFTAPHEPSQSLQHHLHSDICWGRILAILLQPSTFFNLLITIFYTECETCSSGIMIVFYLNISLYSTFFICIWAPESTSVALPQQHSFLQHQLLQHLSTSFE